MILVVKRSRSWGSRGAVEAAWAVASAGCASGPVRSSGNVAGGLRVTVAPGPASARNAPTPTPTPTPRDRPRTAGESGPSVRRLQVLLEADCQGVDPAAEAGVQRINLGVEPVEPGVDAVEPGVDGVELRIEAVEP